MEIKYFLFGTVFRIFLNNKTKANIENQETNLTMIYEAFYPRHNKFSSSVSSRTLQCTHTPEINTVKGIIESNRAYSKDQIINNINGLSNKYNLNEIRNEIDVFLKSKSTFIPNKIKDKTNELLEKNLEDADYIAQVLLILVFDLISNEISDYTDEIAAFSKSLTKSNTSEEKEEIKRLKNKKIKYYIPLFGVLVVILIILSSVFRNFFFEDSSQSLESQSNDDKIENPVFSADFSNYYLAQKGETYLTLYNENENYPVKDLKIESIRLFGLIVEYEYDGKMASRQTYYFIAPEKLEKSIKKISTGRSTGVIYEEKLDSSLEHLLEQDEDKVLEVKGWWKQPFDQQPLVTQVNKNDEYDILDEEHYEEIRKTLIPDVAGLDYSDPKLRTMKFDVKEDTIYGGETIYFKISYIDNEGEKKVEYYLADSDSNKSGNSLTSIEKTKTQKINYSLSRQSPFYPELLASFLESDSMRIQVLKNIQTSIEHGIWVELEEGIEDNLYGEETKYLSFSDQKKDFNISQITNRNE